MRAEDDLAFTYTEATCNHGNIWTNPQAWKNCVETKYCPQPPVMEQGGTVFANNTGNKYGAVCLGMDEDEPVPTTCPLVYVQYEKATHNYKLWVETETGRADTAFFLIQFDAPILDINFTSAGSWQSTFVPQVVAIHADIRLDPESKTAIEFSVDFDHGFSTACIEDIHCDLCDKAQRKASNEVPSDCSQFVAENLANLSRETFYKENTTWPYQTKLDFRCPPGKAFELQDASGSPVNSITVECGWDSTWTWDPVSSNGQLPQCKCKNWIESI